MLLKKFHRQMFAGRCNYRRLRRRYLLTGRVVRNSNRRQSERVVFRHLFIGDDLLIGIRRCFASLQRISFLLLDTNPFDLQTHVLPFSQQQILYRVLEFVWMVFFADIFKFHEKFGAFLRLQSGTTGEQQHRHAEGC